MEKIKYLIHFTDKNSYEEIIKDGYLRHIPEKSNVFSEGIYLQAVFIDKKFRSFYSSKYYIKIDKSILLNRKDYIIKKAESIFDKDGFGTYGGKIVYIGNEKRDKLEKVLNNLTLTNEVIFSNKISLSKYMIKEDI